MPTRFGVRTRLGTVICDDHAWAHILEGHVHDIPDLAIFEADVNAALTSPKLIYESDGPDGQSTIFVGCSHDPALEGSVILVAVKLSAAGPHHIASAYPRSEVPRRGRRRPVVFGRPTMHPCGEPRSRLLHKLGDAAFWDAVRAGLPS